MKENYIWPKITIETTLEEVREIHRRIWDYVIEHGEKPKTPYHNNCVLCQYVRCLSTSGVTLYQLYKIPPIKRLCPNCPAIWTGEWCESLGSEYREWKDSKCGKFWAKKIRDIPFREVE